jgi:hypothetical protein
MSVPGSLTGRQIVVAWLHDEVRMATAADIQRAAEFLAFARDVRKGCKQQRTARRGGWRKFGCKDQESTA